MLARVEALLPPVAPDPDWSKVTAARWRKRGDRGWLASVARPHAVDLAALVAIDAQKEAVERNTRQFVAGLPSNNVLLTGSRGTGKSSLVKAMLAKYAARGCASSRSTSRTSSTCPTSSSASRASASASSCSATT